MLRPGEHYVVGDKLTFGKHDGELIEEVVVDHPTYVDWCLDTIEEFEIDEELHQLLEASIRSVR